MRRPTVPPLQRQLQRVRRRLFLQVLLNALTVGWITALAFAACWFAAQPHLFAGTSPLLRWIVAGAALGLASVVAVGFASIRRPSPVSAALALDERFALKERVTTSMTLAPADVASPAAAALLDDVNLRVERLSVPDRFPLHLPRSAWFIPLTAGCLALVALFYKPVLATPKASADDRLVATAAEKEELDKRIQQLRKKAEEKRPDEKTRSPALEHLDAELDRLTRKSRDTKDDARELIKDLTGIAEQIKKREQHLTQQADALKEQMKQVSRLSKNNNKDGPARELSRALERGDLQKAKNELENLSKQLQAEQEANRLRKKLDDNNLSKEERAKTEQKLNQLKAQQMSKEDRDRLAKQMKDIKDKVQQLSKPKEEKEKALRERAEKGEMDKEQLQTELERLERDAGQLSDKDLNNLDSLAQKLEQAENALKEGNDGDAAKLLEDAGNEMGALDRESELQELAEKLEDCEGCKGAMGDVLDGKPVPSAGRRPESKNTVTNTIEKRERAKMDKGKLSILDTVPGDGIKGPRQPAELTEEIRRASQEAPEAIDRQRLPRSASDMARGYFDKLRGDQEKKVKP
jgi:DNA repair exonuclease SbcCD ATPase subunit